MAYSNARQRVSHHARDRTMDPASAGTLRTKAAALLSAGRLPEARMALETLCSGAEACAEDWCQLGIVFGMLDDADNTERCYRRAAQCDPRCAQAHNNLGAVLLDRGRPEPAVACFETALRLQPDYAMAWNNLGNARAARHQWPEAEAAYARAIALKPDFALAHFNLANACIGRHKTAEAEAALRAALRHRPEYPAALSNLAQLLLRTDRAAEAAGLLEQALRLQPRNAAILNNLGRVLMQLGRKAEAEERFGAALRLEPGLAEAHINLGVLHAGRKRHEPAIACYRAALRHRPDSADAHSRLGIALAALGRNDEALACYRRALQLRPDDAATICNTGLLHIAANRVDEGIAGLRRAIEINPRYAEAYLHLGNAVRAQGLTEEAEEIYRQALAIEPNDLIRIRLATLMPVIPESHEAIRHWRGRYAREVRALLETPLVLTDPPQQINDTNFYLAYHGLDDRELQTLTARLYRHACPSLERTAAHCRARHVRRPGPLRVGFLSMFLRQHSIGKTTRGLVANLDREQFRVYALFVSRTTDDDVARFIRGHSDEAHEIPLDLDVARERIAALELDILFYQDIGMDPFTCFLAYSRLAPVQCLSFGHPDTTGIPNMDWWVSNDLFEPEGAADHYSEKLFLLHDLGTLAYYYRPQPPATLRPRADFELPPDTHVYLCPQTLFKVHPDFDALAAGILRADPKSVVAFIQPWVPKWSELLRARMARALGEDAARVLFIPRQVKDADFLNLLALADVILDTPHFNGMNTSLEAFAVGVPVVTMPREFQRGRHTCGMYRKMGIEECVAASPDEYVAVAVRLATDPAFRRTVREMILRRNHRLYEDIRVVREFERFFLAAAADAGLTGAGG